MIKVFIPQKNKTLFCDSGKNLMDLLIENQIPVASSCLGEGICSKCAVMVNPQGRQSDLEIKTLTRNKKGLDYRLSCQFSVMEDISVSADYW